MLKTNVKQFEQSLADSGLEFLRNFYKKEKMVYFRDVSEGLEQ